MKVKGFLDTIKWYEQNAEQYACSIEPLSQSEEIEDFVSLLPKRSRVLDAGCAAGRDCRLLTDKGMRVVGVDLSKNLIKIAKSKHPNIKFVVGDFLDLPFPDGYFDGVWAHASLVHFERIREVKEALSEFSRVLKKGGIIHLSVKAQTGERKTAVVSDKLSKHKRFFRYFSKEEIKSLLKDAGFEIVSIEQYKESERKPKGRLEVEWIVVLGKKEANGERFREEKFTN